MDLSKALRAISERLHKSTDSIEDKILSVLDMAGQQAVRIARNTKTYKDETGNLTASIGYGVFHFGKSHSIGGFGGGVGEQKGLQKLQEIAADYASKPYVLIVVAGMEYALYVERRGFVVLDAANLQLDNILRSELSKIKVFV